MGVAGQNQIDSHVRGLVDDRGIVREQHGGRAIRNTAHGAAQVGAVEQVVHTRQINLLAIATQFDVPVAQHFDSVVTESVRDFVGANAKIMIPQHRKYSRARAKAAEHLRDRLNIIARPGYKVPSHGDQIGLKFVGKLNDGSESLGRKIQAVVKVGQVNNAEATECLGKAFEAYLMFVDFNSRAQMQPPELTHPVRLPQRILFDAAIAPAAFQPMPRLRQSWTSSWLN